MAIEVENLCMTRITYSNLISSLYHTNKTQITGASAPNSFQGQATLFIHRRRRSPIPYVTIEGRRQGMYLQMWKVQFTGWTDKMHRNFTACLTNRCCWKWKLAWNTYKHICCRVPWGAYPAYPLYVFLWSLQGACLPWMFIPAKVRLDCKLEVKTAKAGCLINKDPTKFCCTILL